MRGDLAKTGSLVRCGCAADPLCYADAELLGVGDRVELAVERPPDLALDRRSSHQTLTQRRGHQRDSVEGSGRETEQRDVGGVAAERGDVVAHPPQRSDLVEHPVLPGGAARLGRECRMSDEAEDAQTVGHGDHHDSTVGKRRRVLHRSTEGVAAPVQVDHHRPAVLAGGAQRRRDIQVEAVLGPVQLTGLEVRLGAPVAELRSVPRCAPRGGGVWWAPPQAPDRRRGVRQSPPLQRGLGDDADHRTGRGLHEGFGGGSYAGETDEHQALGEQPGQQHPHRDPVSCLRAGAPTSCPVGCARVVHDAASPIGRCRAVSVLLRRCVLGYRQPTGRCNAPTPRPSQVRRRLRGARVHARARYQGRLLICSGNSLHAISAYLRWPAIERWFRSQATSRSVGMNRCCWTPWSVKQPSCRAHTDSTRAQ